MTTPTLKVVMGHNSQQQEQALGPEEPFSKTVSLPKDVALPLVVAVVALGLPLDHVAITKVETRPSARRAITKVDADLQLQQQQQQ